MSALASLNLMAIDPRASHNGWIWGSHFLRCPNCTGQFLGALKATKCAPCAYGDRDSMGGLFECVARDSQEPRT